MNVAFTKDAQRVHDSWQTVEDFTHATVLTKIFSTQEDANPYVPHGTNVVIPFFGSLNPAKPREPIGEVACAIDQTFGI